MKDAEVVSGGGKVDWRAIADADRMIFRSSSLKLEAALAELNLAGSQVDSAAVMLGDHQDNNLRSAKPDAFRTALSCRMLTSLAEEMVSEQHREVFRRISYELMLSIYEDYCPPPRNELGRAHSPASRRADLLENEKVAATGLTFDFVPFFCKSQSLEEELLLLRKEVTELRAWKEEHVPILRELREDIDIMTREKDSAQLTAQISTVKHRRLEERLEAVSKYAESESADLRRRIALEVEQGHSLRTSLLQLQKDVGNMVPKTAVETMRGQLSDLVDLVHELQVDPSLLSCVASIMRAHGRLPMCTSADTALEMPALTFDAISNLPSNAVTLQGELQKNVEKTLANFREPVVDFDNENNVGALLKSEEGLKTVSEAANVRGFLERWVASKIDPSGEASAAEASDREFGYDWRDCAKLSRLHRACAPDDPESPDGGDPREQTEEPGHGHHNQHEHRSPLCPE